MYIKDLVIGKEYILSHAYGQPNQKIKILNVSEKESYKWGKYWEADIIYTDTWVSMGQESEQTQRLKKFRDYQVNASLLSSAPKHCLVMHCLPAHPGQEITADVLTSKKSLVFDQAENRKHVQKALLAQLLN